MALSDLIIDDRQAGLFRVKRMSMVSPEIFQLEQARIFDKVWLYVGHESELEQAGDYRRRQVAGRPLVFLRGGDEKIRVFYNACTHRGARICRSDEGNATRFQCFYHAWMFNTKGELVGVPDQAGYSTGFDKRERALVSPPHVDNYRGLWFVSFNPDVVDLRTYLGDSVEFIDMVVDQSAAGIKVLPGSHKYGMNANWKLLVENSMDGYHGIPLHQTYFSYVASFGEDRAENLTSEESRGYDLGNGHAVIETPTLYGRPVASWHPMFGEDAKDDIAAIRTALFDRVGEERGRRIAENIRNIFIYPNLIINDVMALTIRVFWPQAPGCLDTHAWALAPAEENIEQLVRRLDSYLTFLSPAGFATPDDVEALEACQEGFAAAKEVEWSDVSRGMNRTPITIDEVQMRAFWREWSAHIQGLPHGDHWEARHYAGDRVPGAPAPVAARA